MIPMSSGNTNKQIMFLQDMGVTLLVATPSYALHLGEELRRRGIDPSKDLKIRIGLFGGEGMTEPWQGRDAPCLGRNSLSVHKIMV